MCYVVPFFRSNSPFLCTNFFVAGIGEFSEVRPSSFEEEDGPSISEAGKDNKRKRSSKDEDSHSKVGPARGREEDVDTDEVLNFIGRSVDINSPEEDDPVLIARTWRPSETIEHAGLEAPSLKREFPQARRGEGHSLHDLAVGFWTSGSTLRGMGFNVSLSNQRNSGGSIGSNEIELVDAKSTFEEA